MANHLFPTIFESVDEHHFLKNWGHSDLRSQKYAEVAENSLRLIKTFSITKIWFFKLLQIARLMAYQETSNWNQKLSLNMRRPQLCKSGILTNIKSGISWKFEDDEPQGLQKYTISLFLMPPSCNSAIRWKRQIFWCTFLQLEHVFVCKSTSNT